MDGLLPGFLLLLSLLCVSILVVKKEHIVVPLIIAMCFLPADIPVKIGVFHIYAIRAVALFGLLRLVFKGEYQPGEYNKIDKLFFLYNIIGSIAYVVASQDVTQAIINRCGVFVDTIILYIVIRSSIESKSTLHLIIKLFAVCVILLLPFALFEFFSSKNLFSFIGREAISMRDGEIRAATTFSHAILFGTFSAAISALFWAEYKITREKKFLFAFLCCAFFVYASSSSGPVITLACVIFFLFFYIWKTKGKLLAWGVFSALLFIHLVREKTIWHFLYVRVSIKDSSTGHHRYLLTEAAVRDFFDWWILGYGDVGPQWHTKYWPHMEAPFTDVTNQYLLEGVRGGFLTMCLFIMLCYHTLRTLGGHSMNEENLQDQWLWWGFAVMMIANCISFLSVAFFGQITMLLYLTIAVSAYSYGQQQKDLVGSFIKK